MNFQGLIFDHKYSPLEKMIFYLIAEDLNLAETPVKRDLVINRLVIGIDLNVQRKTLDALLIWKVRAQTLHRYADLQSWNNFVCDWDLQPN